MQVRIWLIRHGMTEGNLEQRYVGATDEPLCEKGRQQILDKRMHQRFENVYVSPMRRCQETAEILFPAVHKIVVKDFRECSFGEFEYRNYRELNGNPDYQAWIDSGGTIGFPGGENQKEFCGRVQSAFKKCILKEIIPKAQQWHQSLRCSGTGSKEWCTAMVVHGGTIMAILSKWAVPQFDYFHWQVKNGCGFVITLDTDEWMKEKGRLSVVENF